jgi:hypothetical protein
MEIKVEQIEIAKLEICPGDILIVRVPNYWNDEQQRRAHDVVRDAFQQAGVRSPILIGPQEVEFQVVRKVA